MFNFSEIKKRSESKITPRPQNTNNVKINTLRLKKPRKVPCVKRKVICGMVTICVSMRYGGVFFSVINISN